MTEFVVVASLAIGALILLLWCIRLRGDVGYF
ncbi:hypothetical protein EDF63_3395 [Curtobacterium sp. JUb34]|nr:hypothetical protein EDF63_3395 [Curtobacterium sp. JUb34]